MFINAVTVLEEAQARLRKGWIQKNLAVNAEGKCCNPNDPDAEAWCLLGSIQSPSQEASIRARLYLEKLEAGTLAFWNDSVKRTQAEVIALVEEAIKLAKREQGV